jgi:hypothetical protein
MSSQGTLIRTTPCPILLPVKGEEINPPEHSVFAMRNRSQLEIVADDGKRKTVVIEIGQPKGKKLHVFEPTFVEARQLEGGVGYLKVALFRARSVWRWRIRSLKGLRTWGGGSPDHRSARKHRRWAR